MDTVYVYNLADVSFLLERFFGFDEAAFWSVVRKQLDAYAQSGVTELSRIDRLASDSAELTVESLLKKKILDGARLDFFEHRIRNPLHG
jgi:siderophore synthetase component